MHSASVMANMYKATHGKGVSLENLDVNVGACESESWTIWSNELMARGRRETNEAATRGAVQRDWGTLVAKSGYEYRLNKLKQAVKLLLKIKSTFENIIHCCLAFLRYYKIHCTYKPSAPGKWEAAVMGGDLLHLQ